MATAPAPPLAPPLLVDPIKHYDIRGQGAYGLVVSPALGNIDERGQPIQFPGMVSKIMQSQDSFDKAVRAAETMRARIPSLAQEFTPYRYKFKVGDFSASSLKSSVRGLFKGSWLPQDRVFVARMPDLGVDFNQVYSNPNKIYQTYRNVGAENMCREILKLMHIVKSTKDSGYIHGDIRETNVMCNIHTGTLTIVDFDWFSTVTSFYSRYPTWFYSHPPEHAYIVEMKNRLALISTADKPTFLGEVERVMDGTIRRYGKKFFWLEDPNSIKQAALYSIGKLWDELNTEHKFDAMAAANGLHPWHVAVDQVQKAAAETVDSYGLALSLDRLLLRTIASVRPEFAPMRDVFREKIIAQMLDPNHRTRMRIEQAIEAMEAFIREYYPGIQLGEVPDVDDELRRLTYQAALLADKPLGEILDLNEGRTLREEVEALALVTKIVEGIETPVANNANSPPSPPAGGRRRGKTRKGRGHRRGTKRANR